MRVWRTAGQLSPREDIYDLRARTQILSCRTITRTRCGKERDQLRGVFLGKRLVSIVSWLRGLSLFFFAIYTAACRRGDAYSASPVSRNHSIYGVTTRRRRTFRFEHDFEPAKLETTYFISPDFSQHLIVLQALATLLLYEHVSLYRDGKMVLQSLIGNCNVWIPVARIQVVAFVEKCCCVLHA